MNSIFSAIRSYLFFTVLFGFLYPALVTSFGQIAFSKQANGSLIERDGKVVGSELIAQKFEGDRYFWPRPSAIDFNPLPSGGSNLGPISELLKEAMLARQTKLSKDLLDQSPFPQRPPLPLGPSSSPPQSLLFASASGLDPEIPPVAAIYQISRIAKVRGVREEIIRSIVTNNTKKPQFGFLGEERVNVLKLNLALDEIR